MTESPALYAVHGSTAVVTLHRPERRNALNRELIEALTQHFRRARDESAIRAVIVNANGPAFCAGSDLAELRDAIEQRIEARAAWADVMSTAEEPLARLYDLIYTLPKPTIAAVNGTAVAGGAGLVSVCDLAMAVPEARFGYPQARRGLASALVMPHLLRHVGERAAAYLLLTGELFSADDAVRAGFINAVVPAEELMEKAHQWARAVAEGGPLALAQTKVLLQRFSRQAAAVEETACARAEPPLTEESRQGLQAFFDRQAAPWVRRGP
jgi:methylglutaconyl-CoA hydratase